MRILTFALVAAAVSLFPMTVYATLRSTKPAENQVIYYIDLKPPIAARQNACV